MIIIKCRYCYKEFDDSYYFCPFCNAQAADEIKPPYLDDEEFMKSLKEYEKWYDENCRYRYNGKIVM